MAEKMAFPRTVRLLATDMCYARLEARRLDISVDEMIRTIFAEGVEAHKRAEGLRNPIRNKPIEFPVGDIKE